MPWGRTFYWSLCNGWELLRTRTEKANDSLSFSVKGIVKKQSFKWVTRSSQSLGKQTEFGTLGWRAPIGWSISLIFLRSCISLHCPDFLGTTKIGVFHGLLNGSICPASKCCFTNSCFFSNCSPFSGHWSTQIGISESHMRGRGDIWTVAISQKVGGWFSFPTE